MREGKKSEGGGLSKPPPPSDRIGLSAPFFKTYCSNSYCAPMWFDCTKTALTKLRVAYNNNLRRFMG